MTLFWDRRPSIISYRKRDIWLRKTSSRGTLCPCLRLLPCFRLSFRRLTCMSCSKSSPATIRRWVLGRNKSNESKYSNILFITRPVEVRQPWLTRNKRQHQRQGTLLRTKHSWRNLERRSLSLPKRLFWNSQTDSNCAIIKPNQRMLTTRARFLSLPPLNSHLMSLLPSNCSYPSSLDSDITSRIDISNWPLKKPKKATEICLNKPMTKISAKTRF